MPRKTTRHIVDLFVFAVFAASSSAGAEFSQLFVFGDSLSDSGNLSEATFGLLPGGDYFEGRSSNGRVYAEVLAERLDLDALMPSRSGGTNYAFAGGRTSGTSVLEGGFFIDDLDDQIDRYLEDSVVDPNALYLMLAGANDFVLGGQTDPSIPSRRVTNELQRLVNAGVKHLVTINLPQLGDTPRFRNSSVVMNERTIRFNQQLDIGLDRIQNGEPDITLTRINMQALFDRLIQLPQAFGFTNTIDQGRNADVADSHVFWDDIHPTAAVHELLADAIFSALSPTPLVGDFNFNGEFDAGDVNLLGFALTAWPTDAFFDMNEDNELNRQDMDQLLERAGVLNGDTNLDGHVDFQDFLELARSFEEDDVLWSDGDFDVDGNVAFGDFLILARNFGDQPLASTPSTHSVPEAEFPVLCLWWIAPLVLYRHVRPPQT